MPAMLPGNSQDITKVSFCGHHCKDAKTRSEAGFWRRTLTAGPASERCASSADWLWLGILSWLKGRVKSGWKRERLAPTPSRTQALARTPNLRTGIRLFVRLGMRESRKAAYPSHCHDDSHRVGPLGFVKEGLTAC